MHIELSKFIFTLLLAAWYNNLISANIYGNGFKMKNIVIVFGNVVRN